MRHSIDVGGFAREFHLSRTQTAAVLGVSARTVRRYRQRGSVPPAAAHLIEIVQAQRAPISRSLHRLGPSGVEIYQWRARLFGENWKAWKPEGFAESHAARLAALARAEAERKAEITRRRSAAMREIWRRKKAPAPVALPLVSPQEISPRGRHRRRKQRRLLLNEQQRRSHGERHHGAGHQETHGVFGLVTHRAIIRPTIHSASPPAITQ